MQYRKIRVSDDSLTFEVGAILGLATNQEKQNAGSIRRVSQGVFEVTKPISFRKGEPVWVQKRFVPRSGFEPIITERDYPDLIAPMAVVRERVVAPAAKQPDVVRSRATAYGSWV